MRVYKMERKPSIISVATTVWVLVPASFPGVFAFPIAFGEGKVYLLPSNVIEKARSTGNKIVF